MDVLHVHVQKRLLEETPVTLDDFGLKLLQKEYHQFPISSRLASLQNSSKSSSHPYVMSILQCKQSINYDFKHAWTTTTITTVGKEQTIT